jgi:hypothetical protein
MPAAAEARSMVESRLLECHHAVIVFMKPSQSLVVLLAALLSAWLLACGKYSRSSLAASDFLVQLQPVELDLNDPQRVEFDRLKFLGAFQLRSKDERFGGLSGLAIGADGKLYAVSDRGFWLSSRMHLHTNGRLSDLTDWQIAPLLTPRKAAVRKGLTDAEGLAKAPDGTFLVSFEHAHRIWRYPAPPETVASAALPIPLPSEILTAPGNGGLEAVSVLPDGRILAIAERFENRDGTFKAWLMKDGRSDNLSYLAPSGFNSSDAVALRNGDVLVLERRHQLPLSFAARLNLIKANQIRPGATLKGQELLRLEPPLRTDNFEGVAAMETPQGTMIFLVSDDNFFSFQRTLLLQFLLPNSGRAVD